jgi:hypothetical protein
MHRHVFTTIKSHGLFKSRNKDDSWNFIVIGDWWGMCKKRSSHIVCGLSSSPNIVRVIKSRRMRWAGHVARMGEGRGAYRVLVGRPEGKRPLGIPRRRWEDNIKLDLREIGIDGTNWIQLAQDGSTGGLV